MKKENFNQEWSKIIAKCWNNKEYKQKLLSNPEQTLNNEGIHFAPGVKIQIHENDQSTYHLVLPYKQSESLSEETLKSYAGGTDNPLHCHASVDCA